MYFCWFSGRFYIAALQQSSILTQILKQSEFAGYQSPHWSTVRLHYCVIGQGSNDVLFSQDWSPIAWCLTNIVVCIHGPEYDEFQNVVVTKIQIKKSKNLVYKGYESTEYLSQLKSYLKSEHIHWINWNTSAAEYIRSYFQYIFT